MAERGLVGTRIKLTEKHTLFDLKRQCSSVNGVPERDVVLRYKGREIRDQDHLFREVGLNAGDHVAIPLTWTQSRDLPQFHCLAIADARGVDTNNDGNIDQVNIGSLSDSQPSLTLREIQFLSSYYDDDIPYAGFLLYGWRDHSKNDKVCQTWKLNDLECTTGYMIMANTKFNMVTRYSSNTQYKPDGQIHGAVYWGVFGYPRSSQELYNDSHYGPKKYDPKQAIGEGFSYNSNGRNGFKPASGVFNRTDDTYHHTEADQREIMADFTRECAKRVIDDWKKEGHSMCSPKTYSVSSLKIKVN